MARKPKYHTRLQAVCDGNTPGQLYLIAIRHQMPDPIADLTSYAVDWQVDAPQPKHEIVINGGKAMFSEYPSFFSCIVRDPDGTLFVGEDDGFIRCRDGKAEVFNLLKQSKGVIHCAYVRGAGSVVFGKSNGDVLHIDGNEFKPVQIEFSKRKRADNNCNVRRIHGVGSDFMVAVGDSGLVSCCRGGKWEKIRPPSNALLTAVWCRSETEIYVGGWSGHSWRWDGDSRWQKLKVDFEFEMRDFDFAEFAEYQGTLYAACYDNGIYRLDGDRWVAVPKIQDEDVGSLTATSSGLIGLGALWGDSGSWLTRFDGKTWTAQQVQIPLV